jgi:hypothetical protein
MALTGIMLFRLFKLKNATGGQLILTFLALTVPVLGPSVMIWFYNKQLEKAAKNTSNIGKQKKKGSRK